MYTSTVKAWAPETGTVAEVLLGRLSAVFEVSLTLALFLFAYYRLLYRWNSNLSFVLYCSNTALRIGKGRLAGMAVEHRKTSQYSGGSWLVYWIRQTSCKTSTKFTILMNTEKKGGTSRIVASSMKLEIGYEDLRNILAYV